MHMPDPKKNHSHTLQRYFDPKLSVSVACQLLAHKAVCKVFAWLIHDTCTQFPKFPNLASHPSTIPTEDGDDTWRYLSSCLGCIANDLCLAGVEGIRGEGKMCSKT